MAKYVFKENEVYNKDIYYHLYGFEVGINQSNNFGMTQLL